MIIKLKIFTRHKGCTYNLIHLRGTSRYSMFYYYDLGPGFLTEILSFRIFPQILVKKTRFVARFGPFLADFRTSTLIFKYFGFSKPIICIYFLKALNLSFNLSYNSSMYQKNCGLNNFFTRLTGERNQDLRTRLIANLFLYVY